MPQTGSLPSENFCKMTSKRLGTSRGSSEAGPSAAVNQEENGLESLTLCYRISPSLSLGFFSKCDLQSFLFLNSWLYMGRRELVIPSAKASFQLATHLFLDPHFWSVLSLIFFFSTATIVEYIGWLSTKEIWAMPVGFTTQWYRDVVRQCRCNTEKHRTA